MYKEPLNWIMQEGWRRSPLVHSISVAHSWHTNHGVVVNDISPVTPQATLPLAPTRRGSPLAPGRRGLRKALSARPRFLTITSGGRGNPRESVVWRASPIRGDGAPHCQDFSKGVWALEGREMTGQRKVAQQHMRRTRVAWMPWIPSK
jgi:hypothetical protein